MLIFAETCSATSLVYFGPEVYGDSATWLILIDTYIYTYAKYFLKLTMSCPSDVAHACCTQRDV